MLLFPKRLPFVLFVVVFPKRLPPALVVVVFPKRPPGLLAVLPKSPPPPELVLPNKPPPVEVLFVLLNRPPKTISHTNPLNVRFTCICRACKARVWRLILGLLILNR